MKTFLATPIFQNLFSTATYFVTEPSDSPQSSPTQSSSLITTPLAITDGIEVIEKNLSKLSVKRKSYTTSPPSPPATKRNKQTPSIQSFISNSTTQPAEPIVSIRSIQKFRKSRSSKNMPKNVSLSINSQLDSLVERKVGTTFGIKSLCCITYSIRTNNRTRTRRRGFSVLPRENAGGIKETKRGRKTRLIKKIEGDRRIEKNTPGFVVVLGVTATRKRKNDTLRLLEKRVSRKLCRDPDIKGKVGLEDARVHRGRRCCRIENSNTLNKLKEYSKEIGGGNVSGRHNEDNSEQREQAT
ncbi:hypothetical protein Tco_0322968 [Tanacetum coccineum]